MKLTRWGECAVAGPILLDPPVWILNTWIQFVQIWSIDEQWSRVLRSKHLLCKSMGIVIESSVWEPNPSLYIFIFVASFLSIFLLPNFSNRTLAPFDHGTSPSFLRFQRNFLLIFSLASGHSSSFVFSFLLCLAAEKLRKGK